MELLNQTVYAGRVLVANDVEGADCALLLAKASFDLAPGAEPQCAENQTPVALGDTYSGEPGQSSIVVPSDLCIDKPGTDLLLVGSARPGRDPTRVDVDFQIGAHRRRLRVLGDRHWERILGRSRISRPEPFDEIPLVWERAFGGADGTPSNPKHHAFEARNPIGRGFRAKRSKAPVDGEALPNIEHPELPVRRPGTRAVPAGCGALAPAWEPRAAFAGTYDEDWERDRSPLLPRNFDTRFWDRAPEGLVAAKAPRAGEWCRVHGVRREGPLQFQLPLVDLRARLVLRDGLEDLPLHCDTILVDGDRLRLEMTFSGHRRIQGRLRHVVGVELAQEDRT